MWDSGTRVQTTLLTADSWQEAVAALYSLDARVCAAQTPADATNDVESYPLDLSTLLHEAESAADEPLVSAAVHIVGNSSMKAQLRGTVRRIPWNGMSCSVARQGSLQSPTPAPCCAVTAHVAAGPRTWRVSLEARSVKLTTCSATVFAAHSYGPLQMCSGSTGSTAAASRTFRTHPPVLARQNVTTHLPKGFAAYSLTATKEALEAAFEESLHVEVWSRDVFRKDSLLGLTEVSLASAFAQPLRRSARLPSMVHGFRVFDQVCPLGSAEEKSPDIIGDIRILFFVEDLGPSSMPSASHSKLSKEPGKSIGTLISGLASAVPDQELAALAVEGLEALRSSPAYAVAYSLELWRQQEEERAKIRLHEREAQLREQLEEEYRQRELIRVQAFRQRQLELRELEQRAKKKLLEIQQREISVNAELSNSAVVGDQAKRKAELAIQTCEEALRRQRAETKQALDFEERKQAQLESRLKELEMETSETRRRCSELQAALTGKQALDSSATLSAENELQRLQLQLCEAKVRCETLAASRDHFRRKVEELCQRILQQEVPKMSAPQRAAVSQTAKEIDGEATSGPPRHPAQHGKPSPSFSLEWLQQQKMELLASGLYTDAPRLSSGGFLGFVF